MAKIPMSARRFLMHLAVIKFRRVLLDFRRLYRFKSRQHLGRRHISPFLSAASERLLKINVEILSNDVI